MAHNIAIYSHTGINDSFNLTQSQAKDFFDGKAFEEWRKVKEADQKMQVAIGDRLNGVISACGVIVKAVGQVGRILSRRRI